MPFDGIHNEPELLKQISQGDRDAFRALYQHYYAYIQRYIALFESSGDCLDELTQDVFVRIWEKRGHLERVESLRSYLFLISRNVVFNYLRGLKVQLKVKELEGLPDAVSDDPEDQMMFKQYYRLALEAIEKLSPGKRKVLKMSLDDGLSLDEIAVELKISRAGVKKQLYAATAFVRQYLHEHGEMTVLLLVFLSLFEC